MHLSQKEKPFCECFFELSKFLNIFEKKMTLIADVFPKLWTPKNVVRYMSKKSTFTGPFDRQHVK